MDAQSRRDWAEYDAAAIPTKAHVPQLERWLSGLDSRDVARVLDVGCGAGGVARLLMTRGFSVTGVDINSAAIAALRRALPEGQFHVGDVASTAFLSCVQEPCDAAVCQLVISVVGDVHDRAQLLSNLRERLVVRAPLFISFSGLSDDLNADYADLYARDAAATGELGTYYSRDPSGRVLYRTHHFSAPEILALLESAGFTDIELDTQIETSSRRPDQRARFYYAACRRG